MSLSLFVYIQLFIYFFSLNVLFSTVISGFWRLSPQTPTGPRWKLSNYNLCINGQLCMSNNNIQRHNPFRQRKFLTTLNN